MMNKKINLIVVLLLLSSVALAQSDQYSKISSMPGAFSRMGFGARGMGMGNAMSAVITGNKVAYYNPALSVFQEGNSFQTSYSFLSLDRNLNFLTFTRKFELGKKNSEGEFINKPRIAGVSAGIINASVDNFSQRDNQGNITGELSPYENQFFVGLANQFSEKFTIGFTAKFYYSKLYDEIKTNTFGIDIGAIYRANEQLTIATMVVDLLSKYEWDTTPVYGQEGFTIDDKFPLLIRVGASYKLDDPNLIVAVEFENSDAGTNYLRFGVEYEIYKGLLLRGGLDKFDISNTAVPSRPSLGFSYFQEISSLVFGINYAFVLEPYSAFDQHIIGIDVNF
ncbi:MAG: hypothetical protein L3J41_03845 [Melioribacteraceae bacterium]|nr:hypothetical protein [Melioribacteraceae bacterium]